MLHIHDTPSLSPRQQAFVEHYSVHGNASRAAREAGYPAASAHTTSNRLLKNEKIRTELAARRAETAKRMALDRDRVIQELLAAVEVARTKGDASAMIAGWREIGRMLGFYEPEVRRIDVNLDGDGLMQRIRAMTDAEVLRLADAGADGAMEGMEG